MRIVSVVLLVAVVCLCPKAAYSMKIDQELSGLQNDIGRLSKIRLSKQSPLYMRFYGESLIGKSIAEWIDSRVLEVVLDPDLGACGGVGPQGVPACVSADQVRYRGIVFTSNTGFSNPWNDSSEESKLLDNWIVRISFLIHEARHLDSLKKSDKFREGSTHTTCLDTSEYSDTSDCDNTADGAYGFQAEFLLNVANSCVEGCTKVDRAYAREMAQWILKNMMDSRSARQIHDDTFFGFSAKVPRWAGAHPPGRRR